MGPAMRALPPPRIYQRGYDAEPADVYAAMMRAHGDSTTFRPLGTYPHILTGYFETDPEAFLWPRTLVAAVRQSELGTHIRLEVTDRYTGRVERAGHNRDLVQRFFAAIAVELSQQRGR